MIAVDDDAVSRMTVAPWATVADLPARRPALGDDQWTDLLWSASDTLYALSGRRFPGVSESTVVVAPRPLSAAASPRHGYRAPSGSWPVSPSAQWSRVGRYDGLRVVALPSRPVLEVLEVLVGGAPVTVDVDPTLGHVWRADGRAWPDDGSATIRYRHGASPPAGGRRAVCTLAAELGKSWAKEQHALPRRVESIAREGVTVSMLNSFAALDDGRTGVYEVDLWLREVNPHRMLAPPSVVSPDVARTRPAPVRVAARAAAARGAAVSVGEPGLAAETDTATVAAEGEDPVEGARRLMRARRARRGGRR